jgi:hypothetical protein
MVRFRWQYDYSEPKYPIGWGNKLVAKPFFYNYRNSSPTHSCWSKEEEQSGTKFDWIQIKKRIKGTGTRELKDEKTGTEHNSHPADQPINSTPSDSTEHD